MSTSKLTAEERTARNQRILDLCAVGKNKREIAEELGLHFDLVHTVIKRAKKKGAPEKVREEKVREEKVREDAQAGPDNTVRNARIMELHEQRNSLWEIVDLLLQEGLLEPAENDAERKQRWNLVRSTIRRAKAAQQVRASQEEVQDAGTLAAETAPEATAEQAPAVESERPSDAAEGPAPSADTSGVEVGPTHSEPADQVVPEAAAGDTAEPENQNVSKANRIDYQGAVSEAEVKGLVAGFVNDHFANKPFGTVVRKSRDGWVIQIANSSIHSSSEEALATCRRWLREAGVCGPIDAWYGQEDRVPVERFPAHPAANIMPLLGDAELRELAADISKPKGLTDPIIIYQGKILDGRNRDAACDLAGVRPTYEWVYDEDLGDDGPLGYVLSKNLHRRHLTTAQKREVIAAVLKENPALTDHQAAAKAGATHKTAGKVRRKLEARGEIPHVETRTDSKGRKQPAAKKRKRRGEIPHVEPAVEATPHATAAASTEVPTAPQEGVAAEQSVPATPAVAPASPSQQGELFDPPPTPGAYSTVQAVSASTPEPTPAASPVEQAVEPPASPPAKSRTLPPLTLPPLRECWTTSLAARERANEWCARLDALLAGPDLDPDDKEAVLKRLQAVEERREALADEQNALDLIHDNLWVHLVGVSVEDKA